MAKLNVKHVARIEGHGDITLKVENGKLESIQVDVVEAARYFESMVKGRNFHDAPLVTSRICGICSINHVMASILAIEDAFEVEVNEKTRKLRDLLVYGSYLQNHGTHLYILAAPDYLGLPNVFPLAETAPEIIERALGLKRLGNELCTLVGGRPVHPTTAVVGGFTSEPSKKDLLLFADKLDEAVKAASATVELFGDFSVPNFTTEGDMFSLYLPDRYPIAAGEIKSLEQGWTRPVADYRDIFKEHSVLHSNSKHVLVEGKSFMVGALARVNNNWTALSPSARVVASKVGIRPQVKNPFKNNIAQAIELVDSAVRCAELCREIAEMSEDTSPVEIKPRESAGYGATEAPRGTLYHSFTFDEKGFITSGDVITPTAQNLANLEADMWRFAPTILDLPKEEFILQVEKLVRAYDPCLSCAVH